MPYIDQRANFQQIEMDNLGNIRKLANQGVELDGLVL